MKLQKDGESAQATAAAIKIRAERCMGEVLREMPKASGGQPYHSTGNNALPVETLEDLGIGKMMSSRIQAIAEVPVYTPKRTSTY